MNYKPTIGLEIHIELNTKSKMFCSCLNDSNETKANKNVCPVCLGHPGTLPVANKKAIEKLVKTALALNCKINKESFFERKNYFYPDLPKGYQISQYQMPLSENGYLDLPENKKRINITRIHMEEDTGSLVHPCGTDYSLVNFNRSSVPLMELVTEPDLETASEVKEFIKELQLILKYLNVSNANMEKGEMRCEVNISLALKNAKEFGTKVEIKNLNSIAVAGMAVDYEVNRQAEILDKKEQVVQETRGWHDAKKATFSQRHKEQAHDYRYFPEPDLPKLNLNDDFIEAIKKELPELPSQKRERFKKEYGLNESDIEVFIGKKSLAGFFENTMSELAEWVGSEKGKDIKEIEIKKLAKITANYLISDLLGLIRELSGEDAIALFSGKNVNFKASPENFAEFVKKIYLKEISSKIAKIVLEKMVQTGKDPSHIIREENLSPISDIGEVELIAKEAIKENPKPAQDYKDGKQASLQFLIGQVMAKSKGKASPDIAKETLIKLLK